MESFATVAEYRIDTGDTESSEERIEAMLGQQSAKLYALAGGIDSYEAASKKWSANKKEMVSALARSLVTDSVRKSLVGTTIEGLGDMDGLTQGSFSADGFQASYTMANPSGSAYFDEKTLKAFLKAIKRSQNMGVVMPYYGGR